VINLPERKSAAKFELVFESKLAALGLTSFLIEKINRGGKG